MVQIAAAASGFPPYYYPQEEITATLSKVWSAHRSRVKRLEEFHRNLMIRGRHLAQPLEFFTNPTGFGERNDRFIEVALKLGEQVVCDLLDKAGIDPAAIGMMLYTSISGIAVPSLEARLMNRIPFSRRMKRLPLFGLGCMGGAAGLARAADYLLGHPQEAALVLSVELCSLTVQHQDVSVENVVASGLFADGAAAALLVGDEHPLARPAMPRVIDTRSVLFPDTEHIMGWRVQDTGFKVVLSSDVAEVAEASLPPQVRSFLGDNGLQVSDIGCWLVHPGGPKVMDAMQRGLGLPHAALGLSRENLAAYGNLSSAAVLTMLEAVLDRSRPAPGSYGLLMAMGPGFSAEMVLIRW